jgi:hypothetical protein
MTTTRLTHDTQDVKSHATSRESGVLAQLSPDGSGLARARLRDWLERYWYAVAEVLLLVVDAMPLTKGLVAVR